MDGHGQDGVPYVGVGVFIIVCWFGLLVCLLVWFGWVVCVCVFSPFLKGGVCTYSKLNTHNKATRQQGESALTQPTHPPTHPHIYPPTHPLTHIPSSAHCSTVSSVKFSMFHTRMDPSWDPLLGFVFGICMVCGLVCAYTYIQSKNKNIMTHACQTTPTPTDLNNRRPATARASAESEWPKITCRALCMASASSAVMGPSWCCCCCPPPPPPPPGVVVPVVWGLGFVWWVGWFVGLLVFDVLLVRLYRLF